MLIATTVMTASALLSWGVIQIVLANAARWGLLQTPVNRSSHVRPTAVGGGLGMVVAAIVVSLWLGGDLSSDWIFTLVLGSGLATLGLIDDIRPLKARARFFFQVAVVSGIVLKLSPLPDLVLPFGLSVSGLPLAVVIIIAGVWWINLFNFMDGIDGIAGSQALFMLAAAAWLVWRAVPTEFPSPIFLRILVLIGATAGFLILNWPPARIFMGDVGSTYLGFVLFALALMTIKMGTVSYATWILLGTAFLCDATTTLIQRFLRRERWTEPHRSHAYQRLSRRWGSHRKVVLLYGVFNFAVLAPLAFRFAGAGEAEWLVLTLVYCGCSIAQLAVPYDSDQRWLQGRVAADSGRP